MSEQLLFSQQKLSCSTSSEQQNLNHHEFHSTILVAQSEFLLHPQQRNIFLALSDLQKRYG